MLPDGGRGFKVNPRGGLRPKWVIFGLKGRYLFMVKGGLSDLFTVKGRLATLTIHPIRLGG